MPDGSSAQPVIDLAVIELRTAQFALAVDVIQAIFSLALLVVTGVSVYYAFQAYYNQKERAKKDAACDLARYYAHDIIQRNAPINYALTRSGVTQRIHDLFPMDELKEFDHLEMEDLLRKKGLDPDPVVETLYAIDPYNIYQGMFLFASSIEEQRILASEYLEERTVKPGKTEIFVKNADMLFRTFSTEVNTLLNDLEWFSMDCRYGLADEEMLYQSLHKTFLSQVWNLYPHICRCNKNNEDKLFTNVIWLFKRWSERLRTIREEAREQSEKISQEIEAKKKDLEETERKARQTGPKVHAGKQLK